MLEETTLRVMVTSKLKMNYEQITEPMCAPFRILPSNIILSA